MRNCYKSSSSYKNGCRCEDCTVAQRIEHRERMRRIRRPDSTYTRRIDRAPDTAKQHLLWLVENGVSIITIQRASGVDGNVIRRIMTGKSQYVHKTTEDRLLGVGLHVTPGRENVRDHLEKLMANGWTYAQIAEYTGLSESTIWAVLKDPGKKLWGRTVERAFSLSATTPPPDR